MNETWTPPLDTALGTASCNMHREETFNLS